MEAGEIVPVRVLVVVVRAAVMDGTGGGLVFGSETGRGRYSVVIRCCYCCVVHCCVCFSSLFVDCPN